MGKKDAVLMAYHEALSLVDELHLSIAELAQAGGLKDDRPASLTDDGRGRGFPRTQFVVDGEDDAQRGGLAFDTRLSLCLTVAQAQALLLALSRSLRETRLEHEEEPDEKIEEVELELEIDGRVMIKAGVTNTIRDVLERADDNE